MTPYYSDNLVTLYHGDALDVVPSLTGVSCVVTSPPYNTLGSRIPERPTGMHKRSGWLAKVTAVGYADDMDEDEYVEWQAALAEAIGLVTVPGGSMFYNHKLRYRDKVVFHPLDIVRKFPGWSFRQELIWDRPGSTTFNARMFAPNDERIYWLTRDGADHRWNQSAASWLTVWRLNPESGSPHPAPFPSDLPARCIQATTAMGDVVLVHDGLDMPMGTGHLTYGYRDRGKAWRILTTDVDPALECTGGKVSALHANLIGNLDVVTVDRHITRLATNGTLESPDHGHDDGPQRQGIALAVQLVAGLLRMRPAELQAALWASRRRVHVSG